MNKTCGVFANALIPQELGISEWMDWMQPGSATWFLPITSSPCVHLTEKRGAGGGRGECRDSCKGEESQEIRDELWANREITSRGATSSSGGSLGLLRQESRAPMTTKSEAARNDYHIFFLYK